MLRSSNKGGARDESFKRKDKNHAADGYHAADYLPDSSCGHLLQSSSQAIIG
jgi:hypothetical protein